MLRQVHGDAVALFDPTLTYRYRLSWRWGSGPRVAFVMLNPSTATAEVADPTIRRVRRFAREQFGAGELDVVNLYALRATDPRHLREHPDPVGRGNDEVLQESARAADAVVAAWGSRGGVRGDLVRALLAGQGARVYALRLTRSGAPAHPLYLPASTAPFVWR